METYKIEAIRRAVRIIENMSDDEKVEILRDEAIIKILTELNKELPQIKIGETLMKMGMPTNVKGFTYIKVAVDYMSQENCNNEGITKTIYPYVAKQCNATVARVEKCIRHSIALTWERGNQKLLDEMFGTVINPKKSVPTNNEFLSTLTELLRK